MKTVVFHRIGLSWMILIKEQYAFFVEENSIEWCTRRAWFYEKNCWNLHGPIFEELFVTDRQDRYDLMCG